MAQPHTQPARTPSCAAVSPGSMSPSVGVGGDDWKARAEALLRSHRHALSAMVTANDVANVDRTARFFLTGLSARARRWIGQIDAELKLGVIPGRYGSAGMWGENGRAPAIRDVIHQSKQHRERGAISERKVA